MTLKNAINLFESFVNETSKTSEIKIYREFIEIIKSLEMKDLSKNDIQSIENKLENLRSYTKSVFENIFKGNITHLNNNITNINNLHTLVYIIHSTEKLLYKDYLTEEKFNGILPYLEYIQNNLLNESHSYS